MAHKVFVSYHHENDQKKADHLRNTYGADNTLIDRSLDEAYDGTDDEILASNPYKPSERFHSYDCIDRE